MKTKLIALLTVLISLNTFAQRVNKEKITALKIAHITNKLDLTQKEAQAFWPIYNEHEEVSVEQREALNISKTKEEINTYTEAEAIVFLNGIIKAQEQRLKLNKAYHNKLLKILSAKKVITLMQTERSFRKRMIKEFKNRHRSEKQERKRN